MNKNIADTAIFDALAAFNSAMDEVLAAHGGICSALSTASTAAKAARLALRNALGAPCTLGGE